MFLFVVQMGMEREDIWKGRIYGKGGYMEREDIWKGRIYGKGGYMEREDIWKGRIKERKDRKEESEKSIETYIVVFINFF